MSLVPPSVPVPPALLKACILQCIATKNVTDKSENKLRGTSEKNEAGVSLTSIKRKNEILQILNEVSQMQDIEHYGIKDTLATNTAAAKFAAEKAVAAAPATATAATAAAKKGLASFKGYFKGGRRGTRNKNKKRPRKSSMKNKKGRRS